MREGVIAGMFHSPAQCFRLDAELPDEESPADELARINAGVVGEAPGASALFDVKRVAEMLGDPHPRWDPAPTYMGVPVVVDPHSDRDGPVFLDWTRGPEIDTPEKLARIANVDVDEAPPLDAQTILDEMNRAWVRIIRARMRDDAIEATRLAFSPQECGRLLAEEHAALRWERVARRWATKHPSKWMKLDSTDMDDFSQRMVDAFLRWFYGLEPEP